MMSVAWNCEPEVLECGENYEWTQKSKTVAKVGKVLPCSRLFAKECKRKDTHTHTWRMCVCALVIAREKVREAGIGSVCSWVSYREWNYEREWVLRTRESEGAWGTRVSKDLRARERCASVHVCVCVCGCAHVCVWECVQYYNWNSGLPRPVHSFFFCTVKNPWQFLVPSWHLLSFFGNKSVNVILWLEFNTKEGDLLILFWKRLLYLN